MKTAETEVVKNKGGRPPRRPNPLDPGIVDRICEGLIAGHSLRYVCEPDDMPDQSMVYRAMAKDAEFAAAIARAREIQQEAIIDGTIDLADMATPETVHVAKLQIWARQWRAAKLAPKKWGDRVGLDVDAKVEVSNAPSDALLQILTKLGAKSG